MTKDKARRKTDHRTRVGRERSARTETRILEAAMGVFAEMGPDAPKIDDFAQAAGISRGTFYNYFESVDELLEATSEWTTRGIIEAIEAALAGIDGPALRLGVGLRLFLDRAQADPIWCRFVARVWKVGGVELPAHDLEQGLRLGTFHARSFVAARDLLFGGLREALGRIGAGEAPPDYGAQVTELCLQAVGLDARRIAAVMAYELPTPAHEVRGRRAG
jgi:AcrR family transcriptional regulator